MNKFATFTEQIYAAEHPLQEGSWPKQGVEILREHRSWGASFSKEYSGSQVSEPEQVALYRAIAAGSVSLALILTQHDGACRLIEGSDNPRLAQAYLPKLAEGTIATVGISHLTTSNRPDVLRGKAVEGGYRLSGILPWVTSAPKAAVIVAGAFLEDEQQILFVLPTDTEGLQVQEPFELMGVQSSWTCEVRCQDIFVPETNILRGPTEKVLASRAPVKSLTVSSVGMGLADRLMTHTRTENERQGGIFQEVLQKAEDTYQELDQLLSYTLENLHTPEKNTLAFTHRTRLNDFLSKLASTCTILSKGSGYVRSHPAQKLAREAFFFLVWSAPQAVRQQTLSHIWSDGTSS